MSSTLPERVILDLLHLGVDAITANTDLLDSILDYLPTAELDKAKAYWADHPPDVQMGYARAGATFPLFAVTLQGDAPNQDYLAFGEEALLNDDCDKLGNEYHKRIQGSFTVWIYAEHPDICAWYYRVLRRICNVGARYLISKGLDEPQITGAELIPDPRYTPENIFTRRLTITVEYMEDWTDNDSLWTAIYGGTEQFLPPGGSVDVIHEEQGGGVHPIETLG